MKPRESAPGLAGDRGARTPETGAAILTFPVHRRACFDCGVMFTPIRASHSRCARCYHWAQAVFHSAAAIAALRNAT